MGEIAGRLTDILATTGGASVVQTHYTGTFSQIAYGFPLRFFHKIGATEVDPDTVCNKAGHVALQMTFGTSLDGFDPRSARDAACILVWGANPSASAPHAHRYWLREAPGTVIVIDPIRHPTAAEADLYLQPYPGTDAALAFALLHVIEREGLLDEAFLAERTDRLGGSPADAGRLHPGVGRGRHRRPGGADRGGGKNLRARAVAALAGPGLAAAGDGRQRLPRVQPAPGGDRQYGQARRGLPVPELRRAGH